MSSLKNPPKPIYPFSTVRDAGGELTKVYHGTRSEFDSFDKASTIDGGLHFGVSEQALMRSAGRERRLIEAVLDIRNPRRSKDDGGGWAKKIKSAKSAGHDGIVYLNRYEGISLDTIERARALGVDLDKISDRDFVKMVPESRDSWIAFSPEQVNIINRNVDLTTLKKTDESHNTPSSSESKKKSYRP